MKDIKILCDICGGCAAKTEVNMQVIFTTEQTEGRSTDPYFVMQELDMCEECHSKALAGQYVFAHGAMGHNKYGFKG